MSKIAIKNEVDKLVKDSGLLKHPTMICSVIRIFKMRYQNIDSKAVCKIANESLK